MATAAHGTRNRKPSARERQPSDAINNKNFKQMSCNWMEESQAADWVAKMTQSTGDSDSTASEPNERIQVGKRQSSGRRRRRRRRKIEIGSLAGAGAGAAAAAMWPGKLLNRLASLSLIISLLSLFAFYNHQQQSLFSAHAARTSPLNTAEQPLLLWHQQQQHQARWQPHRGNTVNAMLTSHVNDTSQTTPIRSHQQVAGASTLRPTMSTRQQVDMTSTTIPLSTDAATSSASTSSTTTTTTTTTTLNPLGGDSDVVTAESSNDPAELSPSSLSSSSAEDEATGEPEEPDSLDRRDDHVGSMGEPEAGAEAGGDDDAQPPDEPGQPEESATATFEGIHVRPSRESAPLTQAPTTQAAINSRTVMMVTQPGSSTTLRGGGTIQSSANSRPISSLAAAAAATTTTTTTASLPPLLRRQQVLPTSTTTVQPPVSRSTFDVTMGADRMLIKPASRQGDRDFSERLSSFAPTPLVDAVGRGTTGLLPQTQTQPNRSTFANFLSRSPASQQTTARPPTTTTMTTTPTLATATTTTTMTPGAVAPEDDDSSTQVDAEQNNGVAPTSHELVNESVTHHQHVPMVANEADQRARLMYPSHTGGSGRSGHDPMTGSQQDHPHHHENYQQQQQHQQEFTVASICYTPMSLFLVILVTIAITLIVCFCTLHLVRYLKRHHEFDLVANTKHFDHKHLSGASSSAGYLLQSGAGSGSSASIRAAYQPASARPLTSPLDGAGGGGGGGATRLNTCMLHPFQRDDQCNKCLALTSSSGPLAQTSVSSEPGGGGGGGTYAFRNPYFADELNIQPRRSPSVDAGSVRMAANEADRQQAATSCDSGAMALGVELGGEHMHFIESHIANLHNRQVTSSVKELSSLSDQHYQHQHLMAVAPRVVDLTSDEQQARVRSHPQEGDLVAVDLSGHDIIGLGFDVCGGGAGPRDRGIFVRTINVHGPASESGLIHAGDRIKCLNVTFERMTLQDARDILNCAAPYKMRLLLEKRMANSSELMRMPGTSAECRQQQSDLRSRGGRVPASADAAAHENRSTLETTRDYLKQLTGKLLGAGADKGDGESENDYSQRQLNAASERTSPAAASDDVGGDGDGDVGGCGGRLVVSQQVDDGPLFGSAGCSTPAAAAPVGSPAAGQQLPAVAPAIDPSSSD